MTDDELNQKIESLRKHLDVGMMALVQQKVVSLRMMANQEAHLVVLRDLAEKAGENRQVLTQRLEMAYRVALSLYGEQLQTYVDTGDMMKFLSSFGTRGDVQGN